MRRALVILLVLVIAAPVLRAQQPLNITRVLLYKNGMAYIVRSGQLTAPMRLTFHPEDMNDILKSFSAWNPDTGALYSVGYTAGIPSSHMLSRFPFDISDPQTGLGGFLTQVKGADLRLDHNGRTLEGKLAAVQHAERATAPQTMSSDFRLTLLLKDSSLHTVWLSDVRSVEFVDPQLRDQLRGYLDVLASGRQDVTREVSIYPVPSTGPIQVAYLQQFPLWKTSYRIDLGAKDSRVQGWAQIDNPTGEAWDNVRVSLLSGAPVSFQMNLYDPLYTQRVTLPVPGGQVAGPRQYQSAISTTAETVVVAAPAAPLVDVQNARQRQAEAAQGRLEVDAMQVAPPGGAGGGRGGGGGRGAGAGAVLRPAELLPAQAAFQQADAARVEDFYEYQFPFPVQIASRQSALLPFLQKTMNIERLSVFGQADRSNPRLGARVENNTDIPFESGPVTFFQDGRYAGEAVLDYLPRGEKALVSFGVDNDIQIARRPTTQPETTVRLTVAKGIATLFMEAVRTTSYEVRNKGVDAKSLIIEHPRGGNTTLRDIEPFETTESFYRFRMSLTPGQATTLAVPEVVRRQTTVSLANLTRQQLTLFDNRATPAQLRARLGEIVTLQGRIADLKTEIGQVQGAIDTIFRDQERLRENLKALGTGVEQRQLRARYLEQLQRQEDESDAARARIATLNKEMSTTQATLGDLIANLAFE